MIAFIRYKLAILKIKRNLEFLILSVIQIGKKRNRNSTRIF